MSGLTASVVLAAANRCCVVPQVAEPSTPLAAECTWVDNRCTDNGECSSEAWQIASPGFCDEEEEKVCADGAQTVVTLRRGHFNCAGANQAACNCKWTQDNPEVTQNIQIATCAGHGCS